MAFLRQLISTFSYVFDHVCQLIAWKWIGSLLLLCNLFKWNLKITNVVKVKCFLLFKWYASERNVCFLLFLSEYKTRLSLLEWHPHMVPPPQLLTLPWSELLCHRMVRRSSETVTGQWSRLLSSKLVFEIEAAKLSTLAVSATTGSSWSENRLWQKWPSAQTSLLPRCCIFQKETLRQLPLLVAELKGWSQIRLFYVRVINERFPCDWRL